MTGIAAAAAAASTTSGHSRALWYMTRGFGVVSLVMLTAAVVLGVLASARWAPPRVPRFVIDGLHRNVSMLAVSFLALHIATTVIDGFAPIGWLDAVVPLRSSYRPVWLGMGAVAVDLLLAVLATSLVRVRLGHRAWRLVHWLSYACWPLALVHGIGTGTDAGRAWMLALDIAAVAAVVIAVWWRLVVGWPSAMPARVGAAALSIAMPVVVLVWAASGPLQPGWARASGTPARLLGSQKALVEPAISTAGTVAEAGLAPFTAPLRGTFREGSPGNDGTLRVEIHADVSRADPLVFEAILEGSAGPSGQVLIGRGAVALGTSADPMLYRGSLTALGGGRLRALVTSKAGDRLDLDVTLKDGGGPGTVVTGQLRAERGSASGVDDELSESQG